MTYIRRVGDIPLDEFLSALDKIVEKNIENTFIKYLPELKNYIDAIKTKEELTTTEQVCKELKITRPTLINWYKRDGTKKLLEGTKERHGNKNMYHLNTIKNIIQNNEGVFGKDRTYNYKDEAQTHKSYEVNETTQEIIDNDLSKLTMQELFKKMNKGFELNDEEAKFFLKNFI